MSRKKTIQSCLESAEKAVDTIAAFIDKHDGKLDLRGETSLTFNACVAMLNQNRAIICMLQDLSERMELVETSLGVIRDKNK